MDSRRFTLQQIARLAVALSNVLPADEATEVAFAAAAEWERRHPTLTPSADVPACRDEDPAQSAALAACYPDPPEYQHPEDDPPERESTKWTGGDDD